MGVDIFLQPSWTWSDIGTRHFEADAMRAVENGFTLIRCTSDGESGVVGPTGIISSRQYTGHNPAVAVTFELQLLPRVNTFYPMGGFSFQYLCALFSLCIYVTILLPDKVFLKFYPDFLRNNQHHGGLPDDRP